MFQYKNKIDSRKKIKQIGMIFNALYLSNKCNCSIIRTLRYISQNNYSGTMTANSCKYIKIKTHNAIKNKIIAYKY